LIPPKEFISKIRIRKRVYGFGRGREWLLGLFVSAVWLRFFDFIISPPNDFSLDYYMNKRYKRYWNKLYKNKQTKNSNTKKGDLG